jgi:hypothetical protein
MISFDLKNCRMVCFATSSGVSENGGALNPLVMLVGTNPGLNIDRKTPVPLSSCIRPRL